MNVLNDVARDLRVFADPATDYRPSETADVLNIRMTRNGTQREYTISAKTGRVEARHTGGRRHANFSALLASEEFADIRTFRATQRRVLQPRQVSDYLAPEGQLERQGNTRPLALESFRAALEYTAGDALLVLLLDGPAGIGKTSLIERIVYERADPASSQPPLLHVTSSGSRLTDLNKALAHATQLLRTTVTFDQVPILVRRGVLQVAIDGFDELVDPAGYKDAWSALRDFLGEVHSGGPLLLAGRDTFFDQQSFKRRLADRVPNLDLAYARLHPVSPRSARAYLLARGWSEGDIDSAEAQDWLKPGSYHLRPFFLSQIATSDGWTDLCGAYGSPQAFLVHRFVRRESALVSRMVAIDVANAETALWNFYGTLVEDMASHEVDTVDSGFLALACENAFAEFLSADDMAKLMHKAGSLGLLETDVHHEVRQFPHSEIQNQFLARAIIANLESSAAVAAFLRRTTVSMALAEAFADVFGSLPQIRAVAAMSRLQRLSAEDPFADRLSANIVSLLLAALTRTALGIDLRITSRSTNEARVFGVLDAAILEELSITHLDARGADVRAVTFKNCSVAVLTADANTVFGESRPDIATTLQVEAEGAVVTFRARDDIERWLLDHSIVPRREEAKDTGVDLPLVKYFDRLCRKFVRQHQIRNGPNDEAFFLLQDPMWSEIRPILGERLAADSRTVGGPHEVFYRLVKPEHLLKPPNGDSESEAIRARVIQRARELT